MKYLIFILIVIISITVLNGQSVQDQTPMTWVKRHTVNVPSEAVRSYENIFYWIQPAQEFILHSGHLGLPRITTDWSEPLQTNQTWHYSFASDTFTASYPWFRPPKRCGGKGIYHEAFNRILFHGGGHRLDMGYGYINASGNAVTTDEDERNLWAYDPLARQWYNMRPIYKELLTQTDKAWRGYSFNLGYAKEYGLMLFNTAMGRFIQAYSLHDNRWTYFGKFGTIPEGSYRSASYDLRRHALVIAGNGTETWVFEMGTNQWVQKSYTKKPTTASAWYGGTDGVAYDQHADKHVFIRGDGGAMYTLDLDDAEGWQPITATGKPPSAGHMGQQFHYSPDLNVHYFYAANGSEVWTFRLGPKDPQMPGPPENVTSYTNSSNIHIEWTKPDSGPNPQQYYIYRTSWRRVTMSGLNVGHEPGVYVKIDSTTSLSIDVPVTYSADEWYSYYISSDNSGKESVPSIPAFTTPCVPMGLIASVFALQEVRLKWKRHPGSDIAGYNVYCAMGETPYRSGLTKLNTEPVTSHRFTDPTVDLTTGLIGNYAVTAVNVLGYESGFSPIAFTVPDAVPGLWLDTTSMTLKWNKSLCDTILGYQLVRSAKSTDYWGYLTGGWSYHGSVILDTFATVDNADQYVYGVRAVNIRGQRGCFSDFAPFMDRHAVNLGWYMGDGRFTEPVKDTFWQDLGQGTIGAESDFEEEAGTGLSCYPNPFNPAVVISLHGMVAPLHATALHMTIYNIHGRIVHAFNNAKTNRFTWNASQHASGLYIVRVVAGNRTLTKKIVLQR